MKLQYGSISCEEWKENKEEKFLHNNNLNIYRNTCQRSKADCIFFSWVCYMMSERVLCFLEKIESDKTLIMRLKATKWQTIVSIERVDTAP